MTGLRVSLLMLAMLFVPACTQLTVYRMDPSNPGALTGAISYALPKKTFVVAATYVLKGCVTRMSTNSSPTLLLDVDVQATISGVNEADENERYYVSYSDLRTLFKETNIIVESYPTSQTLKAFSGTINDQVGSILTASLTTAVKFGAAIKTTAAKPPVEYCDASVQKALVDLDDLKKKLEALNVSDDAQPNPAAAPANPSTKANEKGKAAGAGGSGSGGGAPQTQTKATAASQAADLTKKINALVSGKLTSKQTWTWTPTRPELTAVWTAGYRAARKELPIYAAAAKWLSDDGKTWLSTNGDATNSIFIVVYVPAWSVPETLPLPDVAKSVDGLVLRDPAMGSVRVCKNKCPTPQDHAVSDDNLLASLTNVAFPQFGARRVLPLHNEVGQNSTLEISMSEDGVLTKVGMHDTSALGKTIGDLGTAFDAAKAAADARDKAKAAAATAAQTKTREDNKILAECLDAQKNVIKNGGVPIGSCQ